MSRLQVTKSAGTLIRPASTPPSEPLSLSPLDQHPARRLNAVNLFIYRTGPAAADVIREALPKVLIPYYPLAGRLMGEAGGLQVDCCGRGVRFIEGIAEGTLDQFGYFQDVDTVPYDQLVPDRYRDTDGREPLVQLQVTQFECGGFILGLVFSHTISDGLGMCQFLNALAEFARGLQNLSIQPIWCRDFLSSTQPTNPRPTSPWSPPPLTLKLQPSTIEIPSNQITHLKLTVGHKCSTFDTVVATFWMSWARAASFNQGTEVRLMFLANGRETVDPPLPQGFYGNCTFLVQVKASSEWLGHASLAQVVTLIQEAKSKLAEEIRVYKERVRRYLEGGPDLYVSPSTASFETGLYMTSLVNVGLDKVDFGWGPPMHVIPVQEADMSMIALVVPLPRPRQGVRVVARCIAAERRRDLKDRVREVLENS